MFERTFDSVTPWPVLSSLKSHCSVCVCRPYARESVIWDMISLQSFNIFRLNFGNISSCMRNEKLFSESIMLKH